MYSDNEQLYSSEGESEPPKKNFKSNSSIGNSSKAPLSGTSLQGRGLVNPPMQNNHTQEPNSSNRDFFVIPNSNSSHASVSDLDHHTNRPNLSSKNNYERCAHNLTKQSENLGNNTLELLLQTLEAQLEVQTGQESFFRNLSLLNTPAEKHAAIVYILANISQKMEVVIEAISGNQNTANFDSQSNTSHTFLGSNNFVWTKPPKNNLQNRPKEWKNKYLPISFCKEENEAHSIILKNILLQDKNPEQPIPRLIELTKFLLEWAAPKGTSYSNKEVKDKFKNIKIQRRFALLRVCAAYQHFFNHEAPWPKIDEQLEILKKKNSDYRNRYLAKKMASEIDISVVVLPTDEQVEQEIMKDSESLQQDDYTSDEQ
ncbi:hypothetical protein BY996DRAFT_6412609 [Phakopsora pachyrhizi]|nr:hypothetical protein BY996DRAFT_6412609 [Phakopsora pachyrhizi]